MAEYIDRQAVLDAIFPVDPENDGSDGCTVVLQNQSFSSADIEALVSDIPTADVRPTVHAQWEDGPEIKVFKEEKIPTVQCPKCQLYFGDLINNHREIYRFCPYCGAQIDGGTANEH